MPYLNRPFFKLKNNVFLSDNTMKIFDFAVPDLSAEQFIKEILYLILILVNLWLVYLVLFSKSSVLQIGSLLFLSIFMVKRIKNEIKNNSK